MSSPLRGAAACVGVGLAGLGEAPGRSAMELMCEAAHHALQDARIPLSDVDGVFAATAFHSMAAISLSENLGIQPTFSDGSNTGGSSFVAHALLAAMALQMGLCNVALIAYGSNQRTGGGYTSMSERMPYEAVYGPRYPISSYALVASRYMHEYGATRADLAEVAVAARRWAQLNPEAFARGPLSIDDVLAARMISDPLGKLDCCLVTDGAGAIVMVRSDRARDHEAPVYLLGCAAEHSHRMISAMPELTTTAAVRSARRAFDMAGYGPADMNTVQVYDAFTINTLVLLEDLGFCRKGEAKDFVSHGGIAPEGHLPVNTNGGGLSCCHPGMYGPFATIEAVRQARGTCGERQVEGAQLCLAHGNGGVFSSQGTSIWGTQATL